MEGASTPRNIPVYLGERNSKQNSEVQLIYDVLVSGVRQSDSCYIYNVCVLFQIFPYRFLQYIACSCLCCRVSPWYVYVLYIVVCICYSQSPNLSLPLYFPFGSHQFAFEICESISGL